MNFSKHWAATLDDYVIDLAWSPLPGDGQDKHRAGSSQQRCDGKLLAAASGAGAVALFDSAGKLVHQFPGHDNGTNCLARLPLASELARSPDGASKLAGPPHSSPVQSPDGTRLGNQGLSIGGLAPLA